MADSLEILSYNMKILRKMRGYSQEKLSEYSGVSEREISKIERRVVNPSLQMLDGIAKGLNVKPADLLTNRFDPRKVFLVENNVQKTLEEEIRRLSEREQGKKTFLFDLHSDVEKARGGRKNCHGLSFCIF